MATVNKQAIAAAFGRAAAHYEQHADLQRQSADALLAMLPQRKYTHVLDAGCGPVPSTRRLPSDKISSQPSALTTG